MKLTSIPLWGGLCLLCGAGPAAAQLPAPTFAASTHHSASIKPDGSLWTWGINLEGQLGNGTTASSAEPVRVLPDDPTTRWAQVAAGSSHTLALATNGRLYAWGSNKVGQLGTGTAAGSLKPVAVQLPEAAAHATWKQVAAGTSHSLALTADGRLYAWGYNSSGQLGNGFGCSRLTPTEVPLPPGTAGTTWAQVAAGSTHTLALTADGRLFAWGSNLYGQLGDGSTVSSLLPVPVGYTRQLAPLRWAQVAAGRYHTLAVTRDGRLYTWGSNRFGQLGEDRDVQHSLPEPLPLPADLAGTAWTQVAAGDVHSLALSADGRLVAWGNNCSGQLGDGSSTWKLSPVAVPLPPDAASATWTRIVSGGFHSMAYTTNGRLCVWGANGFGQLGDGTTADRYRPLSQDPTLTLGTTPGPGSGAGLSSSGHVEPWGLNDDRLLHELPPAPSYMLLLRPEEERRP